MGWHYENLKNEELQRIAVARFGSILRPLAEIGREAIIEELRKHDEYARLPKRVRKGERNGVANGTQRERG